MRYSIHITNVCPFRCFYCYEDNKDDVTFVRHIMPKDVALDRVSRMINNGASSIEIIGGEPMLFPELIAAILDKFSRQCHFSITTSGMISTQGTDDLVCKYKPTINVSLDDPSSNDMMRRGVRLEEALHNAHRWREVTDVTIHSTFHPNNMQSIPEAYNFYVREHHFSDWGIGVVEEWMTDYYWLMYTKYVRELIDSMTDEEILSVRVHPFANFAPFAKEIVLDERGVELEEIFHPSDKRAKAYDLAKRELACYYSRKKSTILDAMEEERG